MSSTVQTHARSILEVSRDKIARERDARRKCHAKREIWPFAPGPPRFSESAPYLGFSPFCGVDHDGSLWDKCCREAGVWMSGESGVVAVTCLALEAGIARGPGVS